MTRVFSIIRSACLISFFFLLASCGGPSDDDDGGVPPRFVVATRGRAPFENNVDVCPRALSFSVFLEPAGTGFISLEHAKFGSELVDVTWTTRDGRYVVTAPQVRVSFDNDGSRSSDVGWEDLSFEIQDDDGDGTGETGEATATLICDWEEVLSVHTEEFESTFDLKVDSVRAEIAFEETPGLEPIYTFADALDVRSSKPLLTETLSGLTLLADGTPVAATITARDESGPFANGVRVDPVAPLPFDADLTLGATGVTDAFGRAAEFDGIAHHTVADPGPLTTNPSFDGEGGWIGLHESGDCFDGPACAFVSRSGDLVGYLDVPDDAVSLSVVVSLEDFYDECSYAGVSLQSSSGSRGLFPKIPDDDECNDYPYGCSIPWTKSTVSLIDLRGQRVVVRATADRFNECRPDIVGDIYLDAVSIK